MKHYYKFAIAGIIALAIPGSAFGDRDSHSQPWKQTSLVRLHTTVTAARAVGIYAECSDHIAQEECTFTVESARYTPSGSGAASTKFDAMCVDIGFPDSSIADAWNCSPVTIEGLAVSVDASAGGAIVVSGGVNTGSTSSVSSNGQVDLGRGVVLPITQRLQVPMAQRSSGDRPAIRLGGNILLESGIGSVPAGQTLVFGHTPFDGVVTFMVTRPDAMKLSIGYVNASGEIQCQTTSKHHNSHDDEPACAASLDRALRSACELSTGSVCSSTAGETTEPTTAFGPTIDMDELRASLEKRQETIAQVNSDLKETLPDKITEAFELLENDEEGDGASVAAFPRLKIFQKVKSYFQTKVLPKLDEIKETVKGAVNCPS